MLLLLVVVPALLSAEESYPRVIRKGALTCIQSQDAKGAISEQCRKDGETAYEQQYPKHVTRGDQVCTQTLDTSGQVVESCKAAAPRPVDEPRKPAGVEYPRVVRKPGLACVQTLDAKGEVVEECRPDGGDYRPGTPAAEGGGTKLIPQARSATLLENSDPAAGRRMIVEGLAGLLVAPLPLVVLGLACGQRPCDATPAVLAITSSALLMGLAGGIAHILMDGKGGVGWGMIGSSLGFGAAALLVWAAVTLPMSPYLAVVFYALAGILPTAGTLIALEVRDTQMRYGPSPSEEAPVSQLGPAKGYGPVIRF